MIKYIIDGVGYESEIEGEGLDYVITLRRVHQNDLSTENATLKKENLKLKTDLAFSEYKIKKLEYDTNLLVRGGTVMQSHAERVRELKDEVNYWIRVSLFRLIVICILGALSVFVSTILLYKS